MIIGIAIWPPPLLQKLALGYGTLHRAYSMVVDVMQTGKRFLGTYFRVAFFGHVSNDVVGFASSLASDDRIFVLDFTGFAEFCCILLDFGRSLPDVTGFDQI